MSNPHPSLQGWFGFVTVVENINFDMSRTNNNITDVLLVYSKIKNVVKNINL